MPSFLKLTVVGGDQFVSIMIRLAALNWLLMVDGARRQFFGPVHPTNACIDTILIRSANVEDARNPFFVGLFATTFSIIRDVLVLHG